MSCGNETRPVRVRRLGPWAVLHAGSTACGFEVRVRDRAGLESAIARPFSGYGDEDGERTCDLFQKAGTLLCSIGRAHALVDGNKRTSWAGAWLFLDFNGILLPEEADWDVDFAERLVTAVAVGDLAERDAAEGLRAVWNGGTSWNGETR